MNIYFAHRDIEDFVRSLEKSTIAKILRTIDFLERFGHRLGMPHSKAIGNGLFELRVRGIQEVRLLYVFRRGDAIILHGFLKKSNRTPEKEIRIALNRKKSFDKI